MQVEELKAKAKAYDLEALKREVSKREQDIESLNWAIKEHENSIADLKKIIEFKALMNGNNQS
jgi:prefoldin subunit 5